MKKIKVYQSELNKEIDMEYLGKVVYRGDSFGVDSLTDGKSYDIVMDRYNCYKIVDDSGEDYFYDLNNPRPSDGSSVGGYIYVIDDPDGYLEKYGLKREA